jgi:O-antigen ligase
MMRATPTLATGRAQDALLVGASGLAIVAAIALGAEAIAALLLVAVPITVGLSWWRPAYGLGLMLGLVLLTEQYGEILADGMEPILMGILPLYKNLEDFTPLTFVYANLVELWLVALVAIWFVRGVARGDLALRPPACPAAWTLAALAVGATFAGGVVTGGDFKIALWEVRALGYLFGFAWFVPQVLERRRDFSALLWVVVVALGAKAIQGLYRYFVVLRMQLGLDDTFMAHEDPVMFVPLLFLLVALVHYRAGGRLTRCLALATPLMLAALVLTQRRVAYVSLVVCGAFFVAILVPAARRTYARVAVPAALAGALYVLLFYGSPSPLGRPIERAMLLFDSDNASNEFREIEFENLVHTIEAHPWGVGFGHPFEMVRSLPPTWVLYEYIPHNEILWVWVKAGTVGFILVMHYFVRMLAQAVWAHRHLRDPLFAALAAAVAVAVVNQLLVAYYELQLTYARNMVYLGTLFGLLATMLRWDPRVGAASRRWR